MSLQYIIDGCNLTHHPRFLSNGNKSNSDSRQALVNFIKSKKLTGSPRNEVTVVFDGYPAPEGRMDPADIKVVFSRRISADERIREMLEAAANPKAVMVVSDDLEIKSFARLFKARYSSAEDFLGSKDKNLEPERQNAEPEINYSAKHKINEELRKIWLK